MRLDQKWRAGIGLLIVGILISFGLSCGGGGGSNNSKESTPEASATIGPSGRTVEVTNPSSPLYGVRVEVPAGALEADTTITVNQVVSEPQIPETADKVSKIISLKPNGIVFNVPATITIPYDDTNVSDESTLQVYAYNGLSWEGVTFKSRDINANTITALTAHFSDFGVLEPKNQEKSVDTGFMVNRDGFPIKNVGMNCLGMASYAKWFFEKRGGKENTCCNLYTAYDTQRAEEVAKSARDLIASSSLPDVYFGTNDREVADQLTQALRSTHRPTILGITQKEIGLSGAISKNHAVLVYAFEYDNQENPIFKIYDPSDYGQQIRFDGENWKGYSLSTNNGNVVSYVDYAVIEGTSGLMNDVFEKYPFPYLDNCALECNTLVIHGHFGECCRGKVKIGETAMPDEVIKSWTDSEVRCKLGEQALYSDGKLSIVAGELKSNELPFVAINVSAERYFPNNYFLGVSGYGNITSLNVAGPNIVSQWQNPESVGLHMVVNLSQCPIGEDYTLTATYADGNTAAISYTACDVNNNFAWITYPPYNFPDHNNCIINDKQPTLTWTGATGVEQYGLVLQNEQGHWIWSKQGLSIGTTSIVCGVPLSSGASYTLNLHTFDANGNQATTVSTFKVK